MLRLGMFVKFSVQNFRSIFHEQEFSMVAQNQRADVENLIRVNHPAGALLRVSAIYGANASGKSNLLKALRFFQSAIRDSQRDWEPDQPIPIKQFAFSQLEALPTRFVLDFIVDEIRHEYGFSLNNEKFLSEWLYVYPSGRKQIWFERGEAGTPVKFGRELQSASLRSMNNSIKRLVRPNSLLLSTAVQNNYEKLTPIYNAIAKDWISVLASRESLLHRTARNANENSDLKKQITKLIAAADLGLIGYEVMEEEVDESMKKVMRAMLGAMSEIKDTEVPKEPFKIPKISFFHESESGEPVKMTSSDESSGTLAYFGLLGPICEALADGQFIFIDEIESSLHPNLAAILIALFADPTTNPKNAQLVFTTHEVTLLTEGALGRDQIWFTEKGRDGTTQLFPLSDFNIRKDERIGKGYLQGRFGGVPNIDSKRILSQFEQAQETR
jgi:uncharacterized protein